MRSTYPRKGANFVLTILAAAFALALLFLALASPGPAAAQTAGTPTPTPVTEQPDDDTPKPEFDELDPEVNLPIEPVIDEPRQIFAPLSNAVPALSPLIDYDTDDDGLIEISYLEQLNAIRWDLNGSGVPDRNSDASNYWEAFYAAHLDMGCPSSGCRGYELTRSLDFNDAASYISGSVNTDWTQGEGWLPIGYRTSISEGVWIFDAVFDGNAHTVSNLYFDRRINRFAGLVAINTGTILRVGLLDIDLTAIGGERATDGTHLDLAGLTGYNEGLVAHSYATGSVSGNTENVGGLVGLNNGVIAYSYAAVSVAGTKEAGILVGDTHTVIVSSYASGAVIGTTEVGGLTGDNEGGGIIYSYARGSVTANGLVGGITGDNRDSLIRASYWDTQTSGQSVGVGIGPSDGIEGKTSAELKSPTWYHGIYSDWHHAGDVWDFGSSAQYPTLKQDLDLYLDICEQSISAIGRVGIIGEWADDCPSENESGSYARFYTFTLDTATEVTINLMSIKDTYLYLLEGAGRHGRVIDRDDDGGYGYDSRMNPSLQPGTYTIEATTLSSGEAGYFGLIIDGVPLATPPPPFSLYYDASWANANITSVEAGQSFDLTVRMYDVRGAGENGGISVSFPDLTDADPNLPAPPPYLPVPRADEVPTVYSSAEADVKVTSYTTSSSSSLNFRFYDSGDDIYHSSAPNTPAPADYLLVEAVDSPWSTSSDNTLTLEITPKQEGEFRILVRGWICAVEYTNCSRRPTSSDTSDTDQQGYPARELVITITAPTGTRTPEERLAHMYAPILRMHPNERFFPKGVEALVDNAELKYRPPQFVYSGELMANTFTLETLGTLDSSAFLESVIDDEIDNGNGNLGLARQAIINGYNAANWYLDVRDGSNDQPRTEFLPKVYAAIRDNIREAPGKVYLQYYLFYYYDHLIDNQVKACAEEIPSWLPFRDAVCSDHEADWELTQLEFDAPSVQYILQGDVLPDRVAYSQHAWSEDSAYEDIPTVKGHPIVYVSHGKHANYFGPGPNGSAPIPTVKIVPTEDDPWSVSIVQDHISDRGKELLPLALSDYAAQCPDPLPENFHACTYIYELEIIYESTPWVAYEGTWGDSKIDGPDHPDRWDRPDSWMERVNLHLLDGSINFDDKSGKERDLAVLRSASYHWAKESINDGNRVTELDFSRGKTIPPSLSDLSDMEVLDLSNSGMTGIIPRQLSYLAGKLKSLLLGGNNFTGCIPTALREVSNSDLDTLGLPFCAGGSPTPPTPPIPTTPDSCEQQLPNSGIVDADWTSTCDSENQSGSYARYYTFTLSQTSEVTITLDSSVDTVLYLLSGVGRDGEQEAVNDDHGTLVNTDPCADNSNLGQFDSCITKSLAAGSYTIEATTYDEGETGDFMLTVSGIR